MTKKMHESTVLSSVLLCDTAERRLRCLLHPTAGAHRATHGQCHAHTTGQWCHADRAGHWCYPVIRSRHASAPSATANATPRAGITLAPRKPTGTPPAAGELNLTFERSGGFTGRIETFRLKPDGSVDDGKVVLHAAGGPSDAATLATQIAATGIYSVAPGQYMAANTCCDRFEYDLTLTQNGQSYHFITIDSADSEPPALAQTIRLISQYINAAN